MSNNADDLTEDINVVDPALDEVRLSPTIARLPMPPADIQAVPQNEDNGVNPSTQPTEQFQQDQSAAPSVDTGAGLTGSLGGWFSWAKSKASETIQMVDASQVGQKLKENLKHTDVVKQRLVERVQTLNSDVRHRATQGRHWFQEEDFDIQLAYLTPRILLLGPISDGLDRVYSNPASEIARFFQTKHGGVRYVKIFNIGGDHSYDYSRFDNQVTDVNTSTADGMRLSSLYQFCNSAQSWLNRSEENIIALHTPGHRLSAATQLLASARAHAASTPSEDHILGFFATCLLVHLGLGGDVDSAWSAFTKAFFDQDHQNSITMCPSHNHYVHFYASALRSDMLSRTPSPTLFLTELVMKPGITGGCHPTVRVTSNGTSLAEYRDPNSAVPEGKEGTLPLWGIAVTGDVRLEVIDMGMIYDQTLCYFHFHTNFVRDLIPLGQTAIVLTKDKIDMANIDRRFADDFTLEIRFSRTRPTNTPAASGLKPKSRQEEQPNVSADTAAAQKPAESNATSENKSNSQEVLGTSAAPAQAESSVPNALSQEKVPIVLDTTAAVAEAEVEAEVEAGLDTSSEPLVVPSLVPVSHFHGKTADDESRAAVTSQIDDDLADVFGTEADDLLRDLQVGDGVEQDLADLGDLNDIDAIVNDALKD